MVEITFGNDDGPGVDYEHIYERGENGVPQTVITGDSSHPSVDEAADMLEVPSDELCWILTREKERTGGETQSAAVPCSECDREVWTTRRHAAEIEYSSITTTCGRCVRKRDNAE